MNKKQKILITGAALFAALFLFSGGMLAWQFADGRQSADAFNDVADLVQPVENPQPGTAPGETGDNSIAPDPALTAFEKYRAVYEQNSDFVGWITIDGTNINYPVMQTIDNPNYYLKRGFDKGYSNYGVPYVQENCALGISDNIVVYGHHMDQRQDRTGVAAAIKLVYREYAKNNFLYNSDSTDFTILTNKLSEEQLQQVSRSNEQNKSLFLDKPYLHLKIDADMALSVIYALIMSVKIKDSIPNHLEVFDFMVDHLIDNIYE